MRLQGLKSAGGSDWGQPQTSFSVAYGEICQTTAFQQAVADLQAQLGAATEATELLEQVAVTAARLGFNRGLAQAQAIPQARPKVKPRDPQLKRAQQTREAAQARQSTALRQLGEQIREARLARGLSLIEVHSRTLVPLYHLQSLETGAVEKLPEPVYVQGFLRRIAPLLGLDGLTLSNQVPDPDPVQNLIPSWYRPASQADYSLYLYACCAALTVGALGSVPYFAQAEATPSLELPVNPTLPGVPHSEQRTTGHARLTATAFSIASPESVRPQRPERLRLS